MRRNFGDSSRIAAAYCAAAGLLLIACGGASPAEGGAAGAVEDAVPLEAAQAAGRGDTGPPEHANPGNCGPGTERVRGQCVPVLGEFVRVNEDGVIVPDIVAEPGAWYDEEQGSCRPGERPPPPPEPIADCAQACPSGEACLDGACAPLCDAPVATFAGIARQDNGDPFWPSAWSAQGFTGAAAGEAACRQIGADHVCTYAEVLHLTAKGELSDPRLLGLDFGDTVWIQRTMPALVNGVETASGLGARCQDWTDPQGALSDGEYAVFTTSGLSYRLDPDPVFDGTQFHRNGLPCGGALRTILCCFECPL